MNKHDLDISLSCIDLNVECEGGEQTLSHLASLLHDAGCVTDGFCDAILAREQAFPTALAFERITVAIPHTEPEFTKRSALAVGRCVNHPLLKSMENPDESLGVDAVVMLAVSEPEQHLSVLSNLIGLFSDAGNRDEFLGATDPRAVKALFERVLYPEG